MNKKDKIVKILSSLCLLLVISIILDFLVFNKIFGHENHIYKHNLNRINAEYPYAGFVNMQIAMAEKSSPYYNGTDLYDNNEGKIKIAFFGGSTTAFNDGIGTLTIPEYLEQILKQKLKKDVKIINYSAGGSNHRQHLHMLLEFMPKFKPDIVFYYGGVNETWIYYGGDPRPGYPFNYFYKEEIPTWKRFLYEYSAIFRILDEKFNLFHDVDKIRKRVNFESPEWEQSIVDNYFDTMDLSEQVTKSFKSDALGQAAFISVFQPIKILNPEDNKKDVVNRMNNTVQKVRAKIPEKKYAYDFCDKYDYLPSSYWRDNYHLNDTANKKIADDLANILIEKYLKNYKK